MANATVEPEHVYDDERKVSKFNMKTPNAGSSRKFQGGSKRNQSLHRKGIVAIAKDMDDEILLELKYSVRPEDLLSFELSLSQKERNKGIQERAKHNLSLKYAQKDGMLNVMDGVLLGDVKSGYDFELLESTDKFRPIPPDNYEKEVVQLIGNELVFHLFRHDYGYLYDLEVVFKVSNEEEGTGFLVKSAVVFIQNTTQRSRIRKGKKMNFVHRPSIFGRSQRSQREDLDDDNQKPKADMKQELAIYKGAVEEFTRAVLPGTRAFVEQQLKPEISVFIQRRNKPEESIEFKFIIDESQKESALSGKDETETITIEYTPEGAIRGVFKALSYEDVQTGEEFMLVDNDGEYSEVDTSGISRAPLVYGSGTSRKRLVAQIYKLKKPVLSTIQIECQLNKVASRMEDSLENACTVSVISLRVWIQDYRSLQEPRNKLEFGG